MKNDFKYVFLFFVSLCFSCKHSSSSLPADEQEIRNDTNHSASADSMNVEIKTFSENGAWGYDIFINDKMYIHQPHIPAVSGNNGFRSEEAAHTAADFVAFKIRNHIMPPSITPAELDSLGVLK